MFFLLVPIWIRPQNLLFTFSFLSLSLSVAFSSLSSLILSICFFPSLSVCHIYIYIYYRCRFFSNIQHVALFREIFRSALLTLQTPSDTKSADFLIFLTNTVAFTHMIQPRCIKFRDV